MQLPMWNFREQVLAAVDENQVIIVCGETGWYGFRTRRFWGLANWTIAERVLRFRLSC